MALVAFALGKQFSAVTFCMHLSLQICCKDGNYGLQTLYILNLNLELSVEHIFMDLLTIRMSTFITVCLSIMHILIVFIFLILFHFYITYKCFFSRYVVNNFSKNVLHVYFLNIVFYCTNFM